MPLFSPLFKSNAGDADRSFLQDSGHHTQLLKLREARMAPLRIVVRPEVAKAVKEGRPVVALESTLIAHGLPWPLNMETAFSAEAAVRAEGAVPATIAILEGRPTVGLNEEQ